MRVQSAMILHSAAHWISRSLILCLEMGSDGHTSSFHSCFQVVHSWVEWWEAEPASGVSKVARALGVRCAFRSRDFTINQ